MREHQIREKRQVVLDMLAYVRKLADPRYAAEAAGFWLEHQAPRDLRARV